MKKIKFLRVPYFTYSTNDNQRMKCEYFPPLALGVINSYLLSKGIKLDLDDLNVKVHYDNLLSGVNYDFINYEPFLDKERVISYVKGGEDERLKDFVERIVKKTDIEDYDVVLLSSPAPIDLSPLTTTLLIAKYIKERIGAKIIVGGGNGCSQLWQLGLDHGFIDFVVQGPGEVPLVELIRALSNDSNFRHIPGVCYRDQSGIKTDYCSQQPVPLAPNFDGLPLDRYKWFPDEILSSMVECDRPKDGILILPFRFVVGCPFRCAFCCESGKDKRLYFCSPKEAVDCIETLSKKYNTKYFFFLHSTFNFKKDYIEIFCDEIIKRKLEIYWSDCANFMNLDKELLLKMRKAGAIRLIWGLETGSPRLLKYIHKGATIELARQMLQISHEAGIWNGLEIICGLPQEKEDDVVQTIEFLNENRDFLDTVYFNPFYIDGSSLFYKNSSKYGIENIRKIEKYATHKTGKLSDNYVFEFAFDEKDGLKWEDKVEQIANSCDKVMHSTRGGFWTNEMEAILFYLYTNLKDKSKVKEAYDKWTIEFKRSKKV